MQTLTLENAAKFLHAHPQTVRRKAKSGEIPGRKVGKSWLFIDEHLADYVSGRYSGPRQPLQVIDGSKQTEVTLCPSTNAAKHGGLISPRQTDQEYVDLLAPKTKGKRKSCTTA